MHHQRIIINTQPSAVESSWPRCDYSQPPAVESSWTSFDYEQFIDELLSVPEDIAESCAQPPAVESSWTSCDHKMFLDALVSVPEDIAGRWQLIAARVPSKTEEEVRARYAKLEHVVKEIESGRVPLPCYKDDYKKESRPMRKKGTPWTIEEHRKFLKGLEVYGKGDWRNISRNMVITRTTTQVASHAQKYFIRLASASKKKEKKKKRSSIHDITTTSITTVVQPHPPPPPQPQPISSCGGQGGESMGMAPPPPPQPQPFSFYGGQEGGSTGMVSPTPLPPLQP